MPCWLRPCRGESNELGTLYDFLTCCIVDHGREKGGEPSHTLPVVKQYAARAIARAAKNGEFLCISENCPWHSQEVLVEYILNEYIRVGWHTYLKVKIPKCLVIKLYFVYAFIGLSTSACGRVPDLEF